MITLHRLGHSDEPFLLNDDLIVTVEACPDTHVALATGTKIVVTETPEQVAQAVLAWRASVRLAALRAAYTEVSRPKISPSRPTIRDEACCCESYFCNRNRPGDRRAPDG